MVSLANAFSAYLSDIPVWPVLRPTRLLVGGQEIRGAQLVHSRATLPEDGIVGAARALIDQAKSDGVQVVYATAPTLDSVRVLGRLGFEPFFDVVQRNLYLGVGSVSRRLDSSLAPVRSLARYAIQSRQKLLEVELSESWLAHAAQLFELHRPEIDFAVAHRVQDLRARYSGTDCRMLVLRRRAGVGIDAYAILRTFEYKPGRQVVRLLDHWTRSPDRRSVAWLLGELAVWGMAEQADLLQALAVGQGALDGTLVAAGWFRKSATMPFMVRRLADLHLSTAGAQLRAGDLAD